MDASAEPLPPALQQRGQKVLWPQASHPESRTAWAHTCVLAEVLFSFLRVGGEMTNQDRQPYRTVGLAVALACFLRSATTS